MTHLRLALVSLLLAATGCTSSLGFAVALSMHFDDSVTNAALASVASITVDVTGDDKDANTYAPGRAVKRTETTAYYPSATAKMLTLTVLAKSANGELVANGSKTITLEPGKTTDVTIDLDPTTPNADASVDAGLDATVDAHGGDLAGVDANETDLAHALTLSLESTPTYATSGAPIAVATGDLDGNGLSDVIVGDANGELEVRLANTDGSLGAATMTALGGTPTFVVVGDFDKDTLLDVAVSTQASSTILVFRGDGKGGLSAGPSIAGGAVPAGLAAADIDGDGHSDLVVSGATQLAVDYSWSTTGQYLVTGLTGIGDVTTGDVNVDGYLDIVLGVTTGNVIVYPNTTGSAGPRSWGAGVTLNNFASNEESVFVGKAAGRSIIAVSSNGASSFCFGTASYKCGSFPQTNYVPAGSDGILVDIDGDGDDDWVYARPGSQSLQGVVVGRYDSTALMFSAATRAVYATGKAPFPIAYGDFNGDKRHDIVVGHTGDSTISVLLNLPTGIAAPRGVFEAPAYEPYLPPVVGNIDGDKRADIVYAEDDESAAGANVALVIDSDGALVVPQLVSVAHVLSVAIADANGDEMPDLIVGGENGVLTVFPNSNGAIASSGGITTNLALTGAPAMQQTIDGLAAADFDGDKKTDLAIISAGSPNVYVSFGSGGSHFNAAPAVLAVGPMLKPTGIVTGDVNGDGLIDIVVASSGYNAAIVFTQKTGSPGTFNMATYVYSAQNAQAVALADLDRDGNLDLVVGGDNGLFVYAGEAGAFGTQLHIVTGTILDVGTTDLTNDGYADIVAVTSNASQIVALANLGKAATGLTAARFPTPLTYTVGSDVETVRFGDFDGDGLTDILASNSDTSFFFVRNVSY